MPMCDQFVTATRSLQHSRYASMSRYLQSRMYGTAKHGVTFYEQPTNRTTTPSSTSASGSFRDAAADLACPPCDPCAHLGRRRDPHSGPFSPLTWTALASTTAATWCD